MTTTYQDRWNAIVSGNETNRERLAMNSAEENTDMTPGVEPGSEEWFRLVLVARDEILRAS